MSLCKAYCASDSECALFAQEPGGGRGCFLYKTFSCVHDFGWIAGRKRIMTDVGTWEDVPNLRCAGHYKIALWGTPSAQTCKELCAAEKKCTVFSLEQSGGRGCFLFSEKFGCVSDFNWVGGRKRIVAATDPRMLNFDVWPSLRCNMHYKIAAWNTPSSDQCKELCALDPECAIFAQEPFGGRGCFHFSNTFLCYKWPDWSVARAMQPAPTARIVRHVSASLRQLVSLTRVASLPLPLPRRLLSTSSPLQISLRYGEQKKDAVKISGGQHMALTAGFGGELKAEGLGPATDSAVRIIPPNEDCDKAGPEIGLSTDPCYIDHGSPFMVGGSSASPDGLTTVTMKGVLCPNPGTYNVCYRNHRHETWVPWVKVGVVVVGINVFPQLLEDLKQLIIYMDEQKGDPDAYLNVIDWTDQVERSGGQLYAGETRGVVMCVGGSVLITNAYVTMATMRTLGCDLPIEIFHLGQEEVRSHVRRRRCAETRSPLGCAAPRRATLTHSLPSSLSRSQISAVARGVLLTEFGDIMFIDGLELQYPNGHERYHKGAKPVSSETLQGYMLKGFALLQSRFTHCMLFDADSAPVVNPEFLWETPEYRRYGSIFWQDFWTGWVKNEFYGATNISQPGFNVRDIEAGQFIIDKKRHWDAVLATWFLNCHAETVYRFQHGDKDTYPQAFGICGKPGDFFAVPHAPQGAFMEVEKYYSLIGMLQVSELRPGGRSAWTFVIAPTRRAHTVTVLFPLPLSDDSRRSLRCGIIVLPRATSAAFYRRHGAYVHPSHVDGKVQDRPAGHRHRLGLCPLPPHGFVQSHVPCRPRRAVYARPCEESRPRRRAHAPICGAFVAAAHLVRSVQQLSPHCHDVSKRDSQDFKEEEIKGAQVPARLDILRQALLQDS